MYGNIVGVCIDFHLKNFVIWCLCYYSEFHSLCGHTHSCVICAINFFGKREIIVRCLRSRNFKSRAIIYYRLYICIIIREFKIREVKSFSIVLERTYQGDGCRVKGYRSFTGISAKLDIIHLRQIYAFKFSLLGKLNSNFSCGFEWHCCHQSTAIHKANSIIICFICIIAGGKFQCHIVSIQFSFKTCKDRH